MSIKKRVKRVCDKLLERVYARQDTMLRLEAEILLMNDLYRDKRDNIKTIQDVEFKVYSQWGEDGIIQWLIRQIPIENKTFIEFGVEDYKESNTRFLLEENNWSGMIIDGSKRNIDSVKKEALYWRYDLKAIDAFITKENINELLLKSGFGVDLGLLSIDIDGNDYWVWEAIEVVKPRVIICEYNPIFGADRAVSVPYRADFYRTKAHYSNLFFGCSLKALEILAESRGYRFIGTNSNACNAFFVRNDLAQYIPETVKNNYKFVPYKARQARDNKGNLLFLSPEEEKILISDMIVWDLELEKEIKVSEIFV